MGASTLRDHFLVSLLLRDCLHCDMGVPTYKNEVIALLTFSPSLFPSEQVVQKTEQSSLA